MHEMGLVRDVVDVTLDVAKKAGAKRVTRVSLVIGYGRDVVEDLVEGLFRYLARGTIAEGASLELTRVPITVKCNQCGRVFPINLYREDTWVCPECGARLDYKLQSGMEFYISDVQISMQDAAPDVETDALPDRVPVLEGADR